MNIVIYVICFLILLRWGYVFFKFLQTGEFKKKKYVKGEAYVGNIIGILAYTCLRVVIICFLILMTLVSQDKFSDLVMWLLCIFGILALFAYPAYWLTRTSDKAKNVISDKKAKEYFGNMALTILGNIGIIKSKISLVIYFLISIPVIKEL